MTAIRRVASGSLAAWVQIGVSGAIQIALVPLYLTRWDKQTYGVWLMIQATVGLATILDIGHQNYLGSEFLKVGDRDRSLVARIFYSSLPMAAFFGILELVFVSSAVVLGLQHWLFGRDVAVRSALLHQAGIVLVIQAGTWLLLGCTSGIAVRLLTAFGHYPRMAWWGVVASLATNTAPAVAVFCGADLLGAGVVLGLATLLYCLPMFADMWRIINREQLARVKVDWSLGARNLTRSLLLSCKSLLEMARLHGVRLIVGPLVGAGELAAFATMRTGANVALQGLGTVTTPLMPELMRFLRSRDQDRTEAALAFVWLVVLVLLGPAVVVLQCVAPSLFRLWTRGKISFDSSLFAMLSLVVLIYAVAQPAMAIVQGNNLLRAQLTVSSISGATVIGGLLVLVPRLGIRGAGIALLIAELSSFGGYLVAAHSWLKRNRMHWPLGSFGIVMIAVAFAAAGLASIPKYPQNGLWIAGSVIVTHAFLLAFYWHQLPQVARARVPRITRLNAVVVTQEGEN